MTENLKKNKELKNSTLSKVAFGLAIVSVVSSIVIFYFLDAIHSQYDPGIDGLPLPYVELEDILKLRGWEFFSENVSKDFVFGDGGGFFENGNNYFHLWVEFCLEFVLVISWITSFILGIISLFKKGYKKTLAIIVVIIGSIFLLGAFRRPVGYILNFFNLI